MDDQSSTSSQNFNLARGNLQETDERGANAIMHIRYIGMSTKRTAWERFEEDSTS